MEFQKERVYTALTAEKLKIGSKVIVADNLDSLRRKVKEHETTELNEVMPECYSNRFRVSNTHVYNIAYLVSEPAENRLKWTDLKVGDVITSGEITAMIVIINSRDCGCHIFAGSTWIDDEGLKAWEKVNE